MTRHKDKNKDQDHTTYHEALCYKYPATDKPTCDSNTRS